MYEFSYSDYTVFHVHMEKEKRRSQNKRKEKEKKYQENLKTLLNYCLVLDPPPELKILSVLVKIS